MTNDELLAVFGHELGQKTLIVFDLRAREQQRRQVDLVEGTARVGGGAESCGGDIGQHVQPAWSRAFEAQRAAHFQMIGQDEHRRVVQYAGAVQKGDKIGNHIVHCRHHERQVVLAVGHERQHSVVANAVRRVGIYRRDEESEGACFRLCLLHDPPGRPEEIVVPRRVLPVGGARPADVVAVDHAPHSEGVQHFFGTGKIGVFDQEIQVVARPAQRFADTRHGIVIDFLKNVVSVHSEVGGEAGQQGVEGTARPAGAVVLFQRQVGPGFAEMPQTGGERAERIAEIGTFQRFERQYDEVLSRSRVQVFRQGVSVDAHATERGGEILRVVVH